MHHFKYKIQYGVALTISLSFIQGLFAFYSLIKCTWMLLLLSQSTHFSTVAFPLVSASAKLLVAKRQQQLPSSTATPPQRWDGKLALPLTFVFAHYTETNFSAAHTWSQLLRFTVKQKTKYCLWILNCWMWSSIYLSIYRFESKVQWVGPVSQATIKLSHSGSCS